MTVVLAIDTATPAVTAGVVRRVDVAASRCSASGSPSTPAPTPSS